jgi:hypothetical protein
MLRHVPAASLIVKPAPVFDGKQLAKLVYDIAERGVERPFLVDADMNVLGRELEAGACRLLDLARVPVLVVDVEALSKGAKVEGDLSPTEAIAIGRLIEEHVRPIAAAQAAAGRLKGVASRAGREVDYVVDGDRVIVREVAAAALNMSGTTYSRLRDMVVAAEEDPEHFGDVLKLLDAMSISGAHAVLRRRQRELNPPEPVPERKAKNSTVKIMAGRGPAQMVQNTLYSLMAAANLLDTLEATGLPPESIESWADDLGDVCRSLTKFRNRLMDVTKESNGQGA